jgi:hypothetical protein
MGQPDKYIELAKSFGVVIARPRLEPGPEQVETHCIETQILHFDEIRLDIVFIPLERPLQPRFGRDPMRTNRDEGMILTEKVITGD